MKKISTFGLVLAITQAAPLLGIGAQSWAGSKGENEDRRPIIRGMIQLSEFQADDLGVKGKLIDGRKDVLKELYEDKDLARDKIITLDELKNRDQSDADQISKLESQLVRLQEDQEQQELLNQQLKADYEAQKADRERIERELKASKGVNEDGKKIEIKLAKEEENRKKDTLKANEDKLKKLQKSHESAEKVVAKTFSAAKKVEKDAAIINTNESTIRDTIFLVSIAG